MNTVLQYDSYGHQSGYGGYGAGWGDRGTYPPQPGFGAYPQGGPGYGYGNPPPPEMAPSPLDEEIQLVMSEMGSELAALDQAGEWAEQFKNARRLLIAGKYFLVFAYFKMKFRKGPLGK